MITTRPFLRSQGGNRRIATLADGFCQIPNIALAIPQI